MINGAYKYSDLTSKIIGSAITVHKALGIGFQEVIYQRALAIEFGMVGIIFVIGTSLTLVIILHGFFFLKSQLL